MQRQKHISGFILAGGKSSRMGVDKGLLLLDGKTMVQHIIEAMEPHVDFITISTANQAYAEFGYPLLPDDVPDKGPLGGIATALSVSKTERNLIVSCDTPLLSTEAIGWFLAHCKDAEINIATVGEQWHPLLGLYRKTSLPRFAEFITRNQLGLQNAIRQMVYHLVPMDNYHEALENINTKDDFENLKMKHHAR
jgi:molybdopterin-guanine dinucleotide biosynthesis protein A